MNQYPKDWNQATEWLASGELQGPAPSVQFADMHSGSAITPHVGLKAYRRKPQPVKARTVWLNEYKSPFLTFNLSGPYDTEADSNKGAANERMRAVEFREVLPMPDLTDEECTEIFSASAGKIHSFESYIRHVHNELKKMGRSQ